MGIPGFVTDVGQRRVPGAEHFRHFGHHARFQAFSNAPVWLYERIEVPTNALICDYPDIGDSQETPGISALIHVNGTSLQGRALSDIAAALAARIQADDGAFRTPSVQRILRLMLLGEERIYLLPQPLMLRPGRDAIQVVEGNHRYLALILLGVDRVLGFDWNRIAPVSQ